MLAAPLVGAFASGLAPSLVAAALPVLKAGRTDASVSLFVAAAMAGMVLATLAGGFLADRFGRMRAMRFAGWCVLLSVPLVIGPIDVLGRLIQGFGLGLFSVLLPLYLAETQPEERRGRATAAYQFCNSLGGIVGAVCGSCVACLSLSSAWTKILDLGLLSPVAAAFLILVHVLPDSPKTQEDAIRPLSLKVSKALILAVAVLALTSATGVGAILHYSVLLLDAAGLRGSAANLADGGLRTVGLLAAGASMAAIGRKGRRFVLCVGTSGAAAFLAASAALFALLRAGVWTPTRATGVLLAVLLALFLAFFTFGPGVCVWTFAAEILPRSVRAKGMSLALLGNQLVTMTLSAAFLPVASVWGFAPLFALFALAASAYALISFVARQTAV